MSPTVNGPIRREQVGFPMSYEQVLVDFFAYQGRPNDIMDDQRITIWELKMPC